VSTSSKNIYDIDPKDIFSWLGFLKKKNVFIIDNSCIHQLIGFISGYVYLQGPNGVWPIYQDFIQFIREKYSETDLINSQLPRFYIDLSKGQKNKATEIFWIDWGEFSKAYKVSTIKDS
jgi:hypothetical protein